MASPDPGASCSLQTHGISGGTCRSGFALGLCCREEDQTPWPFAEAWLREGPLPLLGPPYTEKMLRRPREPGLCPPHQQDQRLLSLASGCSFRPSVDQALVILQGSKQGDTVSRPGVAGPSALGQFSTRSPDESAGAPRHSDLPRPLLDLCTPAFSPCPPTAVSVCVPTTSSYTDTSHIG